MQTIRITIPNRVKTIDINALGGALDKSQCKYDTVQEGSNIVFKLYTSGSAGIHNVRCFIREWVPCAEEFIHSYSVGDQSCSFIGEV